MSGTMLEAGPELDARVAELMGWTVDYVPHVWPATKAWYSDGKVMMHVRGWHPSTDISDAMQVMEWMQERFAVGMWHVPGVSSVTWGWTVVFDITVFPPEYTSGAGYRATAHEQPLAICLAFVKAMESTE